MRLSKLLAAEIENPNKKRGYVFGDRKSVV